MHELRWIESEASRDGVAEMATDRALLDELEARIVAGASVAPVLRFHGWASPTVSTGRHQDLAAACDLHACHAAGVDLVQRPTGGRAVLHEDELTYTIVAPARGPFEGTGVERAAAAIATGLALGLASLGARVELVAGVAPRTPRTQRVACFASASRSEVVEASAHRKLCGSAQLRSRAALLQHGSLPLRFDPVRQARLLGSDAGVLAARACGLSDVLETLPALAEIEEALAVALAGAFALPLSREAMTPGESSRRAELERAWRADPQRWQPSSTRAAAVPAG